MSELFVTTVLPFNVVDYSARLILSTAYLFRYCVLGLHNDMLNKYDTVPSFNVLQKEYRQKLQKILLNRRYADGVINLVYATWSSAYALGVNPSDIEWKWWLMFQQAEKEYPCRNITLKQDLSFGVTVIHFKGFTDRITIKPTIPKNYKKLLEEILRQKQPYTARVVVDGFGERKSRFWLHGEIHVTIPYNFYLKVMKRFDKPLGNNVGGVDVNVDRISLAILSRDGEVLDYKTFWFEDASRKNYPRHKAWSLISEKIHEMLKYAYYHGVNTLFVENPEVLGKLKILWMIRGERKNENYNYRVTVFRSSIIYRIVWKAPLYGIKVKTVAPKGTTHSQLHNEIMRKCGVDRHTASAIVIAMKGLKLT